MPDILISIRDGMKKLLLLKHDDGRGGGPAHINTHRFNPGNNKNAGNKRIVQFDLCWSVQGYLIEFLHMMISFGFGWYVKGSAISFRSFQRSHNTPTHTVINSFLMHLSLGGID